MAVEISYGQRSERIGLIGKPPATELSRVLDLDLDPVKLPADGIVLSERLAWKLGARVGDAHSRWRGVAAWVGQGGLVRCGRGAGWRRRYPHGRHTGVDVLARTAGLPRNQRSVAQRMPA